MRTAAERFTLSLSERAFTRLRAAEADISCDDAAFPWESRLNMQVSLTRSARVAEA